MDILKKYDKAFALNSKVYGSLKASMGLKILPNICAFLKFKSVLDVGCGPGWSVVEFMKRGYKASGLEPCRYLHENELRILIGLGIVRKGVASNIPYDIDTFDLVFSTDVLEHIPEEDAKKSIAEMIRVSSKYVFCSISFVEAQCYPEMHLHCTVKPRSWWKSEFEKYRVKQVKHKELEGYPNYFLYKKY